MARERSDRETRETAFDIKLLKLVMGDFFDDLSKQQSAFHVMYGICVFSMTPTRPHESNCQTSQSSESIYFKYRCKISERFQLHVERFKEREIPN